MSGAKRKISIVMILSCCFSSGTICFGQELILSEPAAILVEMNSGQVLYEKGADMKWSQPAQQDHDCNGCHGKRALDKPMKASLKAIRAIPSDFGLAGIQPDES